MNTTLRIAIQTKGRLNEDSILLLQEAGIKLIDGKRKLISSAKNFPLEVLYLRDDDIPQCVADGVADVGIVGKNEMEEQKKIMGLGGTMRLGAYPCIISKTSTIYEVYKSVNISERHRHRYEFNNLYLDQYISAGFIPVGVNEKDNLVEIMELKSHPWFIGVQFHPEYKSTVAQPHPLFVAFIKAASEFKSK